MERSSTQPPNINDRGCNDSDENMELRMEVDKKTEMKLARSRTLPKIMNPNRQSKIVFSGMGTDDDADKDYTTFITEDFAKLMNRSAILLHWECEPFDGSVSTRYIGQAFLLRKRMTTTNTTNLNNTQKQQQRVTLVTCKHNIMSEVNDVTGVLEECSPPHDMFLVKKDSSNCNDDDAHYLTAKINIYNTGVEEISKQHQTSSNTILLRKCAMWKYGIDISLGPVIDNDTATTCWPEEHFAGRRDRLQRFLNYVQLLYLVDKEFVYTKGLKVGILVQVPPGGVDPNAFSSLEEEEMISSSAEDITDRLFEKVYGKERDVMIYTGTILEAGEDNIEYDINTYKGCSGSAVIVLDRTHNVEFFGEVIAVHASYNHELKTNIGFKLL